MSLLLLFSRHQQAPLEAGVGSFVLAGQDVAFIRTYLLSAATGSFALTGFGIASADGVDSPGADLCIDDAVVRIDAARLRVDAVHAPVAPMTLSVYGRPAMTNTVGAGPRATTR